MAYDPPKKPTGQSHARFATRCRVNDSLAKSREACDQTLHSPAGALGGVLVWCIHAGAKLPRQCTESRCFWREGWKPRGNRPPGSLDLGEG